MLEQFARTQLLLGKENMERLSNARVAVFGIGGVGSYVVEALVRSGIGALDLIDNDKVCLTNLNRQIIATRKTIGQYKVDVARERCLEINPDVKIHVDKTFYLPETAARFDFSQYDYIVDAIDTVTGKIQLVLEAQKAGTPIISSMGTGNKINPTLLEVADIYQTSVCPLAKVMRRELKKRGVKRLKVVYSKEKVLTPIDENKNRCDTEYQQCSGRKESHDSRRQTPGSTAFVPAAAGLIISGEIIKDLSESKDMAKTKENF